MKEKLFTCPFTGAEFKALEYADGRIVTRHALTGEEIRMNWNCSINKYNIQGKAFRHIETVTFSQAAEILDVSRQRISKIASDNVIQPHMVNGTPVFVLDDVLKYKQDRKIGAPRKEV